MRNTFFAWVPDGKQNKNSSFRLPASPKFAKRHEEKGKIYRAITSSFSQQPPREKQYI
jgi:hypothetical protein